MTHAIDKHRSWVMSRVKGRNTKPELLVRKLLHAKGYRFRLHRKGLPGKPDIVFPARRKVIFVNGCFWHGHDCVRGARMPATNREYWSKKIARNQARDANQCALLSNTGWRVLVIWECEIRDTANFGKQLVRFLGRIGTKATKNAKRTLDPTQIKAPKRRHASATTQPKPRAL
jgi:DNA mismatch endonuclease (patch repair protein)